LEVDQRLDGAASKNDHPNSTNPLNPASCQKNSHAVSDPISFEEAVAAGLVPAHILAREMKKYQAY
ncbi:MAG: hypothetical protein AB1801_20925, partial [Chloroflexota bacterium]